MPSLYAFLLSSLSFSCFSFDNVSGVGDVYLLLGAFCHAIGCTSSFDGPLYYFMVSNFQSHSWKPRIPNARRHYDQTKRMLKFLFLSRTKKCAEPYHGSKSTVLYKLPRICCNPQNYFKLLLNLEGHGRAGMCVKYRFRMLLPLHI